jgi:hypothetical protein
MISVDEDVLINSSKLVPDMKQQFELDTVSAANAVRASLNAFVKELPGAPIQRARDLQKRINADYKICWHVFNTISAPNSMSSVRHIPTVLGIKRFLAAGLEAGVGPAKVEAVRVAIENFASIVNTHAGDRNVFQAMVTSTSALEDDSDDQSHRRASYRSMSQIWGFQVERHLSFCFYKCADDGQTFENCAINVKQGFRKLRGDAKPIVGGSATWQDGGTGATEFPLDRVTAAVFGAPLLREFSSPFLPSMRTDLGVNGWSYTTLTSEGIGRQNSVDLAFGVGARNLAVCFDKRSGEKTFRNNSVFRTPTASYMKDILVHRTSLRTTSVHLKMLQNMPDVNSTEIPGFIPEVKLAEKLVLLGPADQVGDTIECPRYTEIVGYAADKMGWNIAEFDVFRVKVEYPVFGSVIRIEFRG